MKKLKDIFKSPHVQIALATGACIIILAFVSKRLLSQPIGYVPLAIPPFLMTIYEYVAKRYKEKKTSTTWYWVVAIFSSTGMIITYYLL